jgi:Ni,Fe-hydrogenase I cytochrome b subunit
MNHYTNYVRNNISLSNKWKCIQEDIHVYIYLSRLNETASCYIGIRQRFYFFFYSMLLNITSETYERQTAEYLRSDFQLRKYYKTGIETETWMHKEP